MTTTNNNDATIMAECGVGPAAIAAFTEKVFDAASTMEADGWVFDGDEPGEPCSEEGHFALRTKFWVKPGCPRVMTVGTCCGWFSPCPAEED